MPVKPSQYNLFFPFGEDYVLYNTLRKCVFIVDSEFKTFLETDSNSLDPQIMNAAEKSGILLSDESTEDHALKIQFNELRYDSTDLDIITTYECNLSCTTCCEEEKGRGARLDENRARHVAQFIKKMAVDSDSDTVSIELQGGEPLLNMPANTGIAGTLNTWCEETGRKFVPKVVTNGTLLTSQRVEALAAYRCQFLILVYGPEGVHDKKRRYKTGGGTFSDVMEGLARVLDSHLEAVIRMRANIHTEEYGVSLLEFLKENGLTSARISVEPSNAYACRWHRNCMPSTEVTHIRSHLSSEARVMGIVIEQPPPPVEECLALRTSYLVVDPLLRLFRCGILPPCEEYAVGAIDKNGNSHFNPLNIDFLSRDPLLSDQCRACELLPACPGGCSAQILQSEGTTHGIMCRNSDLYNALKNSVTTSVEGRSSEGKK
jgi:uncharacterized protein